MDSLRSSICRLHRLAPVLLATLGIGFSAPDAVAGTAELFQARNGTPLVVKDPVEWVKGNASEANSHYLEGFSIPYRVVIAGAAPGPHYLVLEWDTRHGGRHAIDYVTHYNRLQPHDHFGAHTMTEAVNPLDGLVGSFSAPATFPIPAPSTNGSSVAGQPAASFNTLAGEERAITIWNATITNATYVQELSLGNDSAASRLRIDFIATGGTIVVAFGGHIASKSDWGVGNSAVSIDGSPYHMRMISFDGSGGNQDRSVRALAVGSPPTCAVTGPEAVCGASTNAYTIVTDAGAGATYRWSLTNNTSGAAIVGASDGPTLVVASGSEGSFDIEAVVSAGGLASASTRTIQVNAITGTTPLTDQAACRGGTVTFQTTPSGTGPFTFLWRKGDSLIGGQTNAVLVLESVSAADTGTYCVEVSGACGTVTRCAALAIEPPAVPICPPNLALQCLADVPPPAPDSLVVTGGSGAISVIHVCDVAVTNGCEILITRTYQAVDSCGIGSACHQTIAVRDTMAPMVSGQPNQIFECVTAWNFVSPTATDNCDGVNVAITIVGTVTNAQCGNTFIATRTWQATDACGNTATYDQTVTVVDTTPPVIACAPNRNVECGASWDFDVPSATDLCGGAVTVAVIGTTTNAQCGNTFIATRTWRATDACGNTNLCSQTFTVVDTTAPAITCSPGRNVECGDSWDFDVPSATDLCGGAVTVAVIGTATNAQCGNTFIAIRTWLATDACGNTNVCSQTISVVDTTAPVITCTPSRNVECGIAWDFDAPTTSDMCGDANVTLATLDTITNQLAASLLRATRIWTATDACGNTNMCSQTITVVDTTAPAIVCPVNITMACNDAAGATISYSASATDVCNGNPQVTCQPASGSVFPISITTVRCVALDASGNQSECSFTVSVQDTEPPQLICPGSFAIVETVDGSGAALVTYASVATDNCDMAPSIVCSPPSGSTLAAGTHLVTCTASDASHNEAACTFTIQVVPRIIIVTTTADSGPGTLRQAIIDANTAPGTNVIRFAFPGDPPFTIHLLSPLPALGDAVTVDGWSQHQFTGLPVIEVNGTNIVVPPGLNAATGSVGLAITAGGTVVRGLTLNGFETGIRMEGPGGNVIQGNLIGTDVSGAVALPNIHDGIVIFSPGNLVGGDSPSLRNIIGGNGGSGVVIVGSNATFNLVRGNYIGLAAGGASPLGNLMNGVRLGAGAANNTVGGSQPGQGNVIAFNGSAGVLLEPDAGSGNLILGNSIYSNGGLGIDLGGEGSTENDTGDPDNGPNGLQNAPVLSLARSLNGNTTVAGLAAGSPNSTLLLEFFLNSAPDGSTSAPVLLGTKAVTTDASGEQFFSANFPIAATALQSVNATTTDAANNTSEFSLDVSVQTPPMIITQPASAEAQVGASVTFCVTAIGSQPLLYQWRLNGANVPGATNACLTIPSVQLANGGSYTVVIANDLGIVLSEPAQLALVFGDGSVGDNFADRVRLINANGIKSGNNSAATIELGEPLHGGKPGGRSVWYTWTPPGTGIATFSTEGSTFDTLLAVYTGSNVVALAAEARDEDSGGFYTSRHSFNVFEGTTYQIAIDGFGGAFGGFVISWMFELTHDLLPVITNQPISMTVASGSTAIFTVGAVGTCREVDHDCRHVGGNQNLPIRPDPRRILSYQWFLNGIAIPGATSSTLTISNVQENVLGRYYAEVTDEGRTVRGETAVLQINETGSFVQNFQATDKFLDALLSPPLKLGAAFAPAPPPPETPESGLQFAASSSTVVRGYTGTQVFNTAGSSTESGEASICGRVGGASQWIVYVAQESGTAFFNTDGSSYNTVMAAYARVPGSTIPQYVGCDDNGGLDSRDSAMVIPVIAGRTNLLVVDGVNGTTGTLRLNYSLVTPTFLVPMGTTAEGDARVRVSGRPAVTFTVQRSLDFRTWSSILFTNAPTGVFDYIDTGSAALPLKVYRALLEP